MLQHLYYHVNDGKLDERNQCFQIWRGHGSLIGLLVDQEGLNCDTHVIS